MRPHRFLIMPVLILVALPSLIIGMGVRADSEAGAPNSQLDPERYKESFKIAETVLSRLSQKLNLQGNDDAQAAVDNGLYILWQLLKDDPEQAPTLFESWLSKTKQNDGEVWIIKAASTWLKSAFPVFHIHLDALKNFQPDDNAGDLLVFTNRLLLPISLEDNQVQTSITIRLTQNERDKSEVTWRPTRWGQKNLTRLLAEAQKHLPQTKQSGFLVSVPALNRNFLGYLDNTAIKLVPLTTDQLFKQSEPVSVKDALGKLSEEAMNVDGRRPR